MRYEVHSHSSAAYAAAFPQRIDTHFETTNLPVWNAREGAAEQQELIYEVSWVEELGMWRRFLTSRRTVQN
jgi:hypothetical protein